MAASKAFKIGDLVWAKIKGYPHWPARIDEPQPGQKVPQRKYLIFFFGTHEVGFVKADDLFPFEEYKSKYFLTSKKNRGFAEALVEVIENPTVRHTPAEEEEEEEDNEAENDNEAEEDKEAKEHSQIEAAEDEDKAESEEVDQEKEEKKKEKKNKKNKDEKEEIEKKKKNRKSKDKDDTKAAKEKDSKSKNQTKEVRREDRKAKRRLKKKKRLSAAIVRESSDEEDSESDEEKLHIDVKNDNKEVSASDHSSDSEEPAPKKKKISAGERKSKGNQRKSTEKTLKRKKTPVKEELSEDDEEKEDVDEKDSKEADDQKKVLQEKLKKILEEKHEKEKQKEMEKKKKQEEKERRKEERRKSKDEKMGKQRQDKKQRKKEEKAREKAEEKEERERMEEVDKLRREEEARLAYERLAQESQGDEVATTDETNGHKDDDVKLQQQGMPRKSRELSTQERLEELNDRLKLSLSLANPDPTKCLKIIQEISELPITPEIIKHSRNIVQTLKKVRCYKGNQKVSLKAATLYSHLKSKFVLAGSDMTTQLLKPPTNAILQALPPKTGITPVQRVETSANETVVEEKLQCEESGKKTEIQNEEITSSNIGETKKEQNNGHCEGDAKDVSNLTAGTKTEADDEESNDKTTNNESDNVNYSDATKGEIDKDNDRSLACVDMEIDDDDDIPCEGDSKAKREPGDNNEQRDVISTNDSVNQNHEMSHKMQTFDP